MLYYEARVAGAIMLLVILNLLDLILTIVNVHYGWAVEANPLLDYFLQNWGYLGLAGMKFVLVGGGIAVCWAGRDYRWMLTSLLGLLAVYTGVVLWNLYVALMGTLELL